MAHGRLSGGALAQGLAARARPLVACDWVRRAILLHCAGLLFAIPATGASSLDIPVPGYGLSFGNSTHFSGLRFNVCDRGVSELNGITVTLWIPARNPDAVVRGLAAGAVGPMGRELSGILLGGVGVRGDEVAGISAGLVGIRAMQRLAGFAIAGIGVGAGRIDGIALAGVGLGSGESLHGIALGGIGLGAGEDLRGIAIGGLGAGAGKKIGGICVGGLGVGAGETIGGFCAGGLGVGAGKAITGLVAAGLAIGSGERIRGIALGGVGVGSPLIEGLAASVVHVRCERLHGLALGGWCRVMKEQQGVTVGLLNTARSLRGVQIGLLNHAANNPRYLRWVPILNLHFD